MGGGGLQKDKYQGKVLEFSEGWAFVKPSVRQ